MHYLGASILAGIGFTMSIFLRLALLLGSHELTSAKAAIVTASILSGLVGSFVFKISEDRKQEIGLKPDPLALSALLSVKRSPSGERFLLEKKHCGIHPKRTRETF